MLYQTQELAPVLRDSGDELLQQSVGEINSAAQFRHLLALGIKLLLECSGARELLVQPFPHVIELIFDNREDVL